MNYDLCLHIDSNDPAMLRLVLKNAANYIKGLPGENFQLAVADNSIDDSRLWQGCTVVPAGLVEVVRLQRAGFAYIKP